MSHFLCQACQCCIFFVRHANVAFSLSGMPMLHFLCQACQCCIFFVRHANVAFSLSGMPMLHFLCQACQCRIFFVRHANVAFSLPGMPMSHFLCQACQCRIFFVKTACCFISNLFCFYFFLFLFISVCSEGNFWSVISHISKFNHLFLLLFIDIPCVFFDIVSSSTYKNSFQHSYLFLYFVIYTN